MSDTALDTVLEIYLDYFVGTKIESANEYHRNACIELAALRARIAVLEVVQTVAGEVMDCFELSGDVWAGEDVPCYDQPKSDLALDSALEQLAAALDAAKDGE